MSVKLVKCLAVVTMFAVSSYAVAKDANAGLFDMLNKKSNESTSADDQIEQMNRRRAEGNTSRSSESEKLSEKMRSHMKAEGMDEGCLVKSLKIRQYSLGGNSWAGPQVIDAHKGYQPFNCANWPKENSDKLPKELQAYRDSLVDACGKGTDHTITPLVRFGKQTWIHGNDNFHPYKAFRWLEGACFSRYKIK